MREVSGVSVGDFLVFVGGIGEDGLSRFRSAAAFRTGWGKRKSPRRGRCRKGGAGRLPGGWWGSPVIAPRAYCKRARRAADSAS